MPSAKGPYGLWAPKYLKAGIFTIPLPPNRKASPPYGYTHTGEKRLTPKIIETWAKPGTMLTSGRPGDEDFIRYESCTGNIAIVLPEGLYGLDVDAYGAKEGAAALAALEVMLGGPLPGTWTVGSRDDSASGIRLFKVPEGLAWPGNLNDLTGYNGIDSITPHHRYVIVAPSIHPEGGKYRWRDADGTTVEVEEFLSRYEAEPGDGPDDFTELPADAVELFTNGQKWKPTPKAKMTKDERIDFLEQRPDGNLCNGMHRTLQYWRARINKAVEGGIHDEMLEGVRAVVGDACAGHSGVLLALAELKEVFFAARTVGKRLSSSAPSEWRRSVDGAVALSKARSELEARCQCEGVEEPAEETDAAKWHDFSALVAGKRERAKALYGRRSDDVALIYPGKEHAIYGETEAGKGMFLAMVVAQCLEKGQPVAVIDFEEGDEQEWGSRLIDLGMSKKMVDASLLRYATPSTKDEADANLADAIAMGPGLVVLDGVSAAYGVYGWQIKENDSAGLYRTRLVKPCLDKGIAVIVSDHVVKSSEERGRYQIGGVMKLNLINGAAYLLQAVQPIVRGGEGRSALYLTKDRPGSIKPHCQKGKDPSSRLAGYMHVVSDSNSLDIWVEGAAEEADEGEIHMTKVHFALLDAVEDLERKGIVTNTSKLRSAVGGRPTTASQALDQLVIWGELEEVAGPNRSKIYKRRTGPTERRE
jgi:hypothetical protein